jgi:hypothetical protein
MNNYHISKYYTPQYVLVMAVYALNNEVSTIARDLRGSIFHQARTLQTGTSVPFAVGNFPMDRCLETTDTIVLTLEQTCYDVMENLNLVLSDYD